MDARTKLAEIIDGHIDKIGAIWDADVDGLADAIIAAFPQLAGCERCGWSAYVVDLRTCERKRCPGCWPAPPADSSEKE